MILVIHRSFNYATRSKQCLLGEPPLTGFFSPAQYDSETFIAVKLDRLISALKMQPVIRRVCQIRPLKLFLAVTHWVVFPFRVGKACRGEGWGVLN